MPATSANLGPGYDCFGLALGLFDEITVELRSAGHLVEIEGIGSGQLPCDGSHLVLRAAAKCWDAAGSVLPGVHLRCVNRIPHGGGQGSSAAAIVAGLLAGRALLDEPALVSDATILELATAMEGHPDNVAPALLGGFTLAWASRGKTRVVRRDVHPDVQAVLFTAEQASSTHESRLLLPNNISHADATANSAAAALFVHAITAEPTFLFDATADWLHQRYRASSMPESAALVDDLRARGIAAVVSGAGPSVLVLSAQPIDAKLLSRKGFRVDPIEISASGATVCAAG